MAGSMTEPLDQRTEMDQRLRDDLVLLGIQRCYQCYSCSAGCPVLDLMDVPPHRAVWMSVNDRTHELIRARSPWLCLGCLTCTERCPNGVDVAALWDRIRMAATDRSDAPELDERAFHRLFLQGIRQRGRQYELGLLVRFKMITAQPLRDALLGVRMALRGKLALRPEKVRDTSLVADLFNELKEDDGGR
ncbi:MAG: 4Fe-4S dicluster domain-containing protein [Deltaproteobacteria bacterium]|nr:4Fe-4S dicluster domain-containing protein [Deltaproteobacteria bacterium]MBW2308421.1 4Fe-4S dicluster domain-containing protein [Deltaproteobacteria bacterium]